MKILIADDHLVLRKGLILILAEEFADAHFGEAATTAETLEILARQPWDLLILDIFMPGRTGLEVLHEARRQYPAMPVLALSSAPEEQLALRVLKAGAGGYLNKQIAPEELVKAVKKLLAGGRYVSSTMADRLLAEIAQADHPADDKLSDREYAVLQGLLAGRSIKEIASALSLSAKTVSTFHTRIWEKLNVRNDVELGQWAARTETRRKRRPPEQDKSEK
jgi:DNA-binding NarL/FixJ family response regulator